MKSNQVSPSADNWSSILSDLGIDGVPSAETESAGNVAAETIAKETVEVQVVAKSVSEPEPFVEKKEVSAEPAKPGETKKRFFDRFPKIDLFGPPKEKKGKSLESVVEGVRSPSLSGKSFTSNTIEKVPVSPERVSKRNKEELEKREISVPTEESKENRIVQKHINETKPVTAPLSIDVTDPWAQVAAQVGVLSVEESKSVTVKTVPVVAETAEKRGRPVRQTRQERYSKKTGEIERDLEAAFEHPLRESDGTAALSNLMAGWDSGDSDSRFDKEAEKRLHSILGEERSEESSFVFEEIDGQPSGKTEEISVERHPVRGQRGGRSRESFRDEKEDASRRYLSRDAGREEERTSFRGRNERERTEELSSDRQEERPVRGRRGSKYLDRGVNRDVPVEVIEKPYEERQQHRDYESAERSGCRDGRRRSELSASDDRPKRDAGVESAGRADVVAEAVSFKGIPSWDEAVFALIEKNAAQRSIPNRRR